MYSPLQTTVLDGLKIAYRMQQPERPGAAEVLMIHGWASSGRMWQVMMDGLSPRYRCWALDLPGFGDSDKPENGWYSIRQYIELVAAFCETMNITRPHVIGHSMGGMIALGLAAEHPMPLGRVVAINPVVSGRTYIVQLLSKRPFGAVFLTLGRWAWPLTTSSWLTPWLVRQHDVPMRRIREDWAKTSPHAAVASAGAINRHDLTGKLPGVTVPTLIVIGSRDLTAPNAEGRLAGRLIPGARLEVLPSGHLPTDDLPDEIFRLTSDFLAEERQPWTT